MYAALTHIRKLVNQQIKMADKQESYLVKQELIAASERISQAITDEQRRLSHANKTKDRR